MMRNRIERTARTWLMATFAAAAGLGVTGCSSDLLKVQVPWLTLEKDVANASGAEAMRKGAFQYLETAYRSYGMVNWYTGMFTDEWFSGYNYYYQYDRRDGNDMWTGYAYYMPYGRIRAWTVIEFL